MKTVVFIKKNIIWNLKSPKHLQHEWFIHYFRNDSKIQIIFNIRKKKQQSKWWWYACQNMDTIFYGFIMIEWVCNWALRFTCRYSRVFYVTTVNQWINQSIITHNKYYKFEVGWSGVIGNIELDDVTHKGQIIWLSLTFISLWTLKFVLC